MNAQEIFDTVAKHLAAQGGKAVAGSGCAYRSPTGRKCAVGCLILDAEYTPAMDSDTDLGFSAPTVGGLDRRGLLPPRLAPHLSLLAGLQRAHDHSESGEEVRIKLTEAAVNFGLSRGVLDTLTFPAVWQ